MKQRLIILTILIHFISCHSCNSQYDRTFESGIFKRLIELNEQGKHEEALIYAHLYPTDTSNIYILKEISLAHFMKKNYDSAKFYNSYIIRNSRNNVWAWYLKASIHYELDQDSEVVACIDSAIRFKGGESAYIDCNLPKDQFAPCTFDVEMAVLRFLRGECLIYTKRNYLTAYKDLTFCIKQKYEIDSSYYFRAHLLLLAGETILAKKDFETAMRMGIDDFLGLKDLFAE